MGKEKGKERGKRRGGKRIRVRKKGRGGLGERRSLSAELCSITEYACMLIGFFIHSSLTSRLWTLCFKWPFNHT